MEEKAELALLKQQITEQGNILREVKDSQLKVAEALLGSYQSIGLIEEHRNQKKEIETYITILNAHSKQITELETFRSDIKKIVAFIAVVIPVIFELAKSSFNLIWEFFKKC
jgi:hypothetical protein